MHAIETATATTKSWRATAKRWPGRAAALALLALVPTAPAAAHTYVLQPVADTYVRQAAPNNSYGTSGVLQIRNGASGQTEHSFVRFAVPPLAGGVSSATLTLRVTGTIQEVGTYAVSMGTPNWNESQLTWNNWGIGTSFTFLTSRTNLGNNTNHSTGVTPWVSSNASVTFGLASGINATGQRFSSKEGNVAPTLTIVTSGNLAKCRGPGDVLAELNSLVQTGNLLYGCDYKKNLSPTFGAWAGGSENLPVIAATVALFDGPVVNGTDYRVWWQNFFAKQAATSGSGHVNYFKGSELFSNVYDASTVAGIIVARYWANLNNHTAIRNLSADYLRRSWYAWALATSPQSFDSIYRNQGPTRTFIAGQTGSCPTLALASPRSKMGYGIDTKRWMTAKFLGYNQTCYKFTNHKPILDYVAARDATAYGLTNSERNALRALINNTTLPSNLGAVLGAVRMERDFHFLLWSDGRRATFYEGHQLNNNVNFSGIKHTVFTAMFNRSTRDLDLLFIEGRNNTSCVQNSTNRVFARGPGVTACSSSNYITVPSNPTHHFVLGPNGWRSCSSLSC